MKNKFKVGDFVAARLHDHTGGGGDLALGQVIQVTRTRVKCLNLITGKESNRKKDDLEARNSVIPQDGADEILRVNRTTGDKKATRLKAVEVANRHVTTSKFARTQHDVRAAFLTFGKQIGLVNANNELI